MTEKLELMLKSVEAYSRNIAWAELSDVKAEVDARIAELRGALKGYMIAVELMNLAMKDGINVQGAMSALMGWEAMAREALSTSARGEK